MFQVFQQAAPHSSDSENLRLKKPKQASRAQEFIAVKMQVPGVCTIFPKWGLQQGPTRGWAERHE